MHTPSLLDLTHTHKHTLHAHKDSHTHAHVRTHQRADTVKKYIPSLLSTFVVQPARQVTNSLPPCPPYVRLYHYPLAISFSSGALLLDGSTPLQSVGIVDGASVYLVPPPPPKVTVRLSASVCRVDRPRFSLVSYTDLVCHTRGLRHAT